MRRSAVQGFFIGGQQYCDEAVALFARMDVQAPDELKILINIFIQTLKDSGTWYKLDALYFRSLHSIQASLLNWIKDANYSILANSPTFLQYGGILCNSGKYIDSNYNPYTDGINWKVADYSAMYLDAVGMSSGGYPMLGRTGEPRYYWFSYPHVQRGYYLSANYAGWGAHFANTLFGHSYEYKNGNEYNNQYLNGVYIADRWQPQEELISWNMLENYSGNATRVFSAYGKSLLDSDHLIIYNALVALREGIFSMLNYGDELIKNGGFDTDADWIKSSGSWTISGGKAHYDYIDSGAYIMENDGINDLISGHTYKLKFTISNCETAARITFLNHVGTALSATFGTSAQYYNNGTHEILFVAAANTRLRIAAWTLTVYSSSFSIDNISIKEVL